MPKKINRSAVPHTKKRFVLTVLLFGIIAFLVLASYLVLGNIAGGLKLDYIIKPFLGDQKTVQVDLTIRNFKSGEKIQIYKGSINSSDEVCTDGESKKISLEDKEGIIGITGGSSDRLHLSYKVGLGEPGKHGHNGAIYDDMVAFAGESVLLLPIDAYNADEKELRENIRSVSIGYDVPKGYNTVVPYVIHKGNKTISRLKDISWTALYNLRKSCFAFGKFEKYEYKKGRNLFTIYSDNSTGHIAGDETRQGLNSLYDYYNKLFEYSLPDYSVILLRKDPVDRLYILGGSGAYALGSTFDPANKRDWELMSHRFFHAFFESKTGNNMFHAAPNVWFYEGLAAYYENIAMSALPEKLKKELSVNVAESFLSLYRKYVYMTLKDPALLSMAPMDEEKLQGSQARMEFLHYTQAPLAVKAIEDISSSKYGTRDRMLKAIVEYSNDKELKISAIVHHALDEQTNEFAQKYLFGREMLPFFQMGKTGREDADKVIKDLNEIEYTLWTWFRQEIPGFPTEQLELKGLDDLVAKAEQGDIHFTTAELESRVKAISPTVYKLLKVYAFRAKLCGLNYSDLELRIKLLGDRYNLDIWEQVKAQ